MITQQQQNTTHFELSKLFDPTDGRLTVIERAALRVAMCMLLNKPIEAGEQAEALEMLVKARRKELSDDE